jgi:anti-sigma factor RsiW
MSLTQCPTEDLLLDYAAGHLDPVKVELFDRHADSCARCASLRAAQVAVWRSMDEWKPAPVGEGFNRELWRRIDAEEQKVSWAGRLASAMPFGHLWKRAAPLAVVMALVVTAFVWDHSAKQTALPAAGAAPIVVTVSDADQLEQTLDDIQLLHEVNAEAAAAKTNPRIM